MTPLSTYPARRVRRLGDSETMRRVRIVHALDGIGGDVPPEHLLDVGSALWHCWRAHHAYGPHDVILGLDAGGIVPALAVALVSGTPYRLAWKVDLDLPHKFAFQEPHARRTDVYVYGPLHGRRVLIVDDEVTSGHTISNLVGALHGAGASVVGVLCLVEVAEGMARNGLAEQGLTLCSLTTL
ncbi:phosphoribosyltransferase [Actinoallomurus purpureus]|uniref:phosphoribosyltransferase n=1 Tax=Actinoallomurus purpureus TaxID=478114 RepID=UPI002092E43F|nr:phosphoribosyltransferase [Actinoallomurus purpureus]MCO6003772.1 phosphoribosyltransferase [Actinoallomurus purpureus]